MAFTEPNTDSRADVEPKIKIKAEIKPLLPQALMLSAEEIAKMPELKCRTRAIISIKTCRA